MADKIDQLKIGSNTYDIDLPIDNTVRNNTVFNATSLSYKAGATTAGAEKSVRWYCSSVDDGINGITTPYDGMKIMVKIPRAGLATVGAMLSINGNTDNQYHPVAYNVNTVFTSHFPVNSFKVLIYNASATMTGYITAGTAETITGVWQCESDYDSNTNTQVRQYQAGTTARSGTQYPILTRYNTTDKAGSYEASYARYHTNTYIDTSTGNIYAPAFYKGSTEIKPITITNTSDTKSVSDGTNILTFGSNAFNSTPIPTALSSSTSTSTGAVKYLEDVSYTSASASGSDTFLKGVKATSSADAAPDGHTHTVTATGSVGLTANDATATGRIQYVQSVSGGSASGTGAGSAAPSGHTHSYTKPTGVSLGSNTTSTDGVKYVEDISSTGASASGTAKAGSETHTHTYDKTTGITLTANKATATGRIQYIQDVTHTAASLTGTTTFVTGYSSFSGGALTGTTTFLTAAIKSATISGTPSTSGSGSATRHTLTIAVTTEAADSTGTVGFTPASLGTASTSTVGISGGSISKTTKYLSAAPSTTSTNSGTPSATTSFVTGVTGGTTTATLKYFHPSVTTTSDNTGANSGTAISTISGVSYTAPTATLKYLSAAFSGTSATTAANSGTKVTAVTGVGANGTGSAVTGITSGSVTKTTKYMKLGE